MYNGFVKVDCGILESSLWQLDPERVLFLTALFMARPHEVITPEPQLSVKTMKPTGWVVPPGWYGLVEAAPPAIIDRAKVARIEPGDPIAESQWRIDAAMNALEALGEPEIESRSPEYEGRRLVRIAGGFIVLNFMRFRDDQRMANAERQRRYRIREKERRHKSNVTRNACNVTRNGVTSRVTQAEAEAEADNTEEEVPSSSGYSSSSKAASAAKTEPEEPGRPTLAKFLAGAALRGISEKDAKILYEEWEAADWCFQDGRPIRKWQARLVKRRNDGTLPSQIRLSQPRKPKIATLRSHPDFD